MGDDSVNVKTPGGPDETQSPPPTPPPPVVPAVSSNEVPHFKLKAKGYRVFRNRLQLNINAEVLQKDRELLQWFVTNHADCFAELPDFTVTE